VARAYVDQLERERALSASMIRELRTALDRSQPSFEQGRRDQASGARLRAMAKDLAGGGRSDATEKRVAALRQVLTGIADKLS
jgi:hypothetical protein